MGTKMPVGDAVPTTLISSPPTHNTQTTQSIYIIFHKYMQPFLTTNKTHTLKDAFCKNTLIFDENILLET